MAAHEGWWRPPQGWRRRWRRWRARHGIGLDRHRLAIVAIFRNEAPYVLEWIAYHRALGVARFYIADNQSDDGTTALLRCLERLRIVHLLPFPNPPDGPPQMSAYRALMDGPAGRERWVAVIDADEFLVPTAGDRTVADLLRPFTGRDDVGAIALNWAVYGSSGQITHDDGLVIERFSRRAHEDFAPNLHYKSIVRMEAYRRPFGNPHHFVLDAGRNYADAAGLIFDPQAEPGPGIGHRLVWQPWRINHYLVKSRAEFDHHKRHKGSAAKIGRVKGDRYFQVHDRNEVEDPMPAWLIERTHAEIARLQSALAGLPAER